MSLDKQKKTFYFYFHKVLNEFTISLISYVSNKPEYCMMVSVTLASMKISNTSKEHHRSNRSLECIYAHHLF